MGILRNRIASGISMAALAFAGAAHAQDAAEPAQQQGGLEEIVVTAQKREQNLQSVPVSVTALGAEAIENARIADFSDLTRAAPSLTYSSSTSSLTASGSRSSACS